MIASWYVLATFTHMFIKQVKKHKQNVESLKATNSLK
jgi:hypothetical protein